MTESVKKLFKSVLSEQNYKKLQDLRTKIYMKISPRKGVGMIFRSFLGYDMPWDNPQDLNEKINWMKLYSDTDVWSRLGDKYRVREYIREKGYGDLLVPLIGKWDHVEEIKWDALPDSFVMKMNNGSGDILICKDKSLLDVEAWKKRFKRLFKKDFGTTLGEFHYAKMKPCIIAEERLDAAKQSVKSTSLIDYKLWCFNGEVTYILVYLNRQPDSVQVTIYDTEWTPHPEHFRCTPQRIQYKEALPRPSSLPLMIKAASDLSRGIPQVRVDFYEVDGKLYFGEMTFTSHSGYMDYHTKEFLLELGKKVKL
jgi:hypothetical protein